MLGFRACREICSSDSTCVAYTFLSWEDEASVCIGLTSASTTNAVHYRLALTSLSIAVRRLMIIVNELRVSYEDD
jgi:hypothetical protein